VGRKKPILVVKSGRTEAGARAASSHTGAMAGLDVTLSAFLEPSGVQRANTIEELFDLARAFDRCPLPRGRRVAIVTNAGGPGIMATDACVNFGLEMVELADATKEELRTFLPSAASIANPVDMIASATPEDYRRALEVVLADPSVDMAMAINVTPLLTKPGDVIAKVAEGARSAPDKPVLAVVMATADFYQEIHGRRDLPPVYGFPESAALALAKLERYAAWRRQPPDEEPPEMPADDRRVAEILERTDDGYLPAADAFSLLEAYGVPVVPWRRVASAGEVPGAAEELGFPVVLKAVAPELVHKSDVGAVAVDLRTPGELRDALGEMERRLEEAGSRPRGYLLQKLAKGGHEVIFGISTDPRYGPLLMFGLGGKYVEVFRDVRFAASPVTRTDARRVVRGIRGVELLQGVRGEPPADLELLEEVLLRLAQLADRHPRIQELDVNPFLATPRRADARALDVRVRVHPRKATS
jgi:acetyltransferase